MKNRNIKHKDHWQTPPKFYEALNNEYHFDFDPVPLHADFDCLELDKWGGCNFINSPYSLKAKESILIDAIRRSKAEKSIMICLLPVSTSTKLWHDHIKPNMADRAELRGRLKFIGTNDKGQIVNHPNPTDETFEYNCGFDDELGADRIVEIPLHVKNTGQHDSMMIVFDGRSLVSKLIHPIPSIEEVLSTIRC